MPSWRSAFRRRASTQTLRTTFEEENSTKDHFLLPISTKLVEEQTTAPVQLPAPGADVHEVRFFLYHLLTYKGNNIARRWPQWILETCAYWSGSGAALREWEGDFQLLVPKSAGHAELDKNSKYVDSPPGDCRLYIGTVIGRAVKKMKAEEETAFNHHQQWLAKERGSGSQHSVYRNAASNFSTSDVQSNFGTQGYPMQATASFMSLPASYSQQSPYSYAGPIHPSLPSHFAPSVHDSMYARHGTACQSIDVSPTSSGDSGATNSTDKTTPPSSVEESTAQQRPPSRYGKRSRPPLHPVAEMAELEMQSAYSLPAPGFTFMPTVETVSDAASCRSTLRPSRSQMNCLLSGNYVQASASYPDQTPHMDFGSHQSRPPSIYSTQHGQASTASLHQGLQNLQFAEQMQRQGSPASVLSRASHGTIRRTSTPGTQRHPPMSTTSLSYPRSDISRVRDRTPSARPPSLVSSQSHQIPPFILGKFPIHEPPRVPVLKSFTSADRTFATASTDQFALTQGLLHSTQATDPAKAREVARREIARMQGIMPSNLRREGLDPSGPTLRKRDELTGQTQLTLVEAIATREALQGKLKNRLP
ncbi:hypothetical protein K458DRAFT_27868 [Lentithecium fluviatile CBS 122367]|uniref:Uncharacterized protein n=1 Tax=Lentithecium fluviatile CBS 122367 TaxID=1168545 RepID=A0A6G1J2X2_9PLEO|nr:hypothetical protein K458DRAFT_27868 [Lentithecium fluviatile CBS 122367]